MKNKLILFVSVFFIVNIAIHDFIDHHDHISSEYFTECNACEENVDVKIEAIKTKDSFDQIKYLSNLFLRFIPSNKFNLDFPRAPPLN